MNKFLRNQGAIGLQSFVQNGLEVKISYPNLYKKGIS